MEIVNLMSFYIGLMNLNQNLTQRDKQQLLQGLNNKIQFLLKEIHSHLESQDQKLDKILERLEKKTNDN